LQQTKPKTQVFTKGEDTHSLRLTNKFVDLRLQLRTANGFDLQPMCRKAQFMP
jgi:hypothetical protein